MMSGHEYFSERTLGPAPLDQANLGINFWRGFTSLIDKSIADGSLAEDFPEQCFDRPTTIGTRIELLKNACLGEIPDILWPLNPETIPADQMLVFDLIEFFYPRISKPVSREYNAHHKHHYLTAFDREAGKEDYRSQANQLFRRNHHPYELKDNGQVERIGPPILDSTLHRIRFHTGDTHLDGLLEAARSKFSDPDPAVRKESLEKLWDAWERIRSFRDSRDIQASILNILQEVAPEPNFRERLNTEARELNFIGDNFMIRHARTSVTPISGDEQADYLFHRMFSLIWLVLKKLNLAS